MNKLQLLQMKDENITQLDRASLVDLYCVSINSSLPTAEKVQNYFEQIANPYCFLCGETPVRVRFVAENRTLKELLCAYFSRLK